MSLALTAAPLNAKTIEPPTEEETALSPRR
jgi:hypothetical protein